MAAAVGAVEPMALELDGHGGENLAHLFGLAFGAHGDGSIVEGLVFGEVVSASFAAVVVRRQGILQKLETIRIATGPILIAGGTGQRGYPIG